SIIQTERAQAHISTDASGKKGIGSVWFEKSQLFSTRILRRHRSKHINWKELLPINNHFCNNTAVVRGINKQPIRETTIKPLQSLFLLTARRNIDVTAI